MNEERSHPRAEPFAVTTATVDPPTLPGMAERDSLLNEFRVQGRVCNLSADGTYLLPRVDSDPFYSLMRAATEVATRSIHDSSAHHVDSLGTDARSAGGTIVHLDRFLGRQAKAQLFHRRELR